MKRFTVASLLLSLLLPMASGPLLAAAEVDDRLHGLAPANPALTEAFSLQWQQQRGAAPRLLDHPTDTILTVATHGQHVVTTTPVVWLELPRQIGPASAGHSGIYREADAAALLSLWQQLLPEHGPAGLLVGANSRGLWPGWRQQARQRGLTLKPGFVRAGEQAHRVYGLLRPSIAVLLYSSDMATHDSIAVSVILRESLSSGLPVLGTERSLLPAGALAVRQQPAAATGAQAAELALALLRGEQPGWQEPRNLVTEVNYQVARTLQLPLSQLPAPARSDGLPDAARQRDTDADLTEPAPDQPGANRPHDTEAKP
ncbi:MAG: hypothetical protein ACOY3E_03835 [Pseudomonadota bacterium]